jgi:hypothetical protein
LTKIEAFCNRNAINIEPTSLRRDWMDETWQQHAYRCFPLQLGNTIGYQLSLPVDLKFRWNGVFSESGDNVEVLSGRKYVYTTRGHATISIKTGITFSTPENITMLQIPAPNFFNPDYQAFTTLISTSWYYQEIPSAIRILSFNKDIVIKAGEPYATLIPISLSKLQDMELELKDYVYTERDAEYNSRRNKAFEEIRKENKWTDWYRNATDFEGNVFGKHEVKQLKMKITDNRSKKRGK